MGIADYPCWLVNCDGCDCYLGSGMSYDSEAEAKAVARDNGWDAPEEGDVLCGHCKTDSPA